MPRKREFNKDEVMEQAMLLFWEQGYEATSMRALQKAMGISSSSMYETFGDKHHIFRKALERYCEIERKQVSDLAQSTDDVVKFLQNMFAMLDEIVPGAALNHGSMTFNAMAELGVRDTVVTELLFSHFIAIAEIIAEVLEQAQIQGTLSSDKNPTHLAHFILNTLQGLATIKSVRPDYPYVTIFQQIVIETLNS